MILYFLRHGLAGLRSEWEGDDFGRPLTEEGISRTKKTGKTLAEMDLDIDKVITSPLIRAKHTAKIVAEKTGLEDQLIEDERLAPGFDRNKLQEILSDYPEDEVFLLVGHEPDFSLTISSLIRGGEIICKKGGLARVDIVDRKLLTGQLAWLIPPKFLAG